EPAPSPRQAPGRDPRALVVQAAAGGDPSRPISAALWLSPISAQSSIPSAWSARAPPLGIEVRRHRPHASTSRAGGFHGALGAAHRDSCNIYISQTSPDAGLTSSCRGTVVTS